MALFFILVVAVALLGGLLLISIGLQDLDRSLGELAEAMEGRYGTWLQRSAEERRRAKAEKAARESPPSSPTRPPAPGTAPAKG